MRRAGFSDVAIGRELGVTRQAVRKRWPHAEPAPRGRAAQGFRKRPDDAEARRQIRAMGWSVSDATETGSGFPKPELLERLIDDN